MTSVMDHPRIIDYQAPQPRVSSESVRVLFWNVWYGPGRGHTDDVIKALQRFDCDILVLYEVDEHGGLPEKIHKLGYGGSFVETNRFRGRWPVHAGIALFSKFPIHNTRIVPLRRGGRGPFRGKSGSLRAYIEAEVEVRDGLVLTIAGTHISHRLTWDVRMGKMYRKECAALLQELGRHRERFIFGADLNAPPWFWIAEELLQSKRLAHLGPPLKERSWPMRRVMGVLGPLFRVDYVFGTRDVKVRAAKFGDPWPSDHGPIVLEVAV